LASGSELASALIGEAVYQARSAVLLLSLLLVINPRITANPIKFFTVT